MKLFLAALLCAGTLLPFKASAAEAEAQMPAKVADRAVYGEYPLGYKLIIQNFLKERLLDFPSAKLEWQTEPKPERFVAKGKRPIVGYSVYFKVNSRNRFGMYTGWQPYRFIIRNGEVVHVDRPDPRRRR